ncbi:hypothetical protein [Psychroflexus aurantiacus]|nr:hypothetical protein [Psychroflexus aurantiacus]
MRFINPKLSRLLCMLKTSDNVQVFVLRRSSSSGLGFEERVWKFVKQINNRRPGKGFAHNSIQ